MYFFCFISYFLLVVAASLDSIPCCGLKMIFMRLYSVQELGKILFYLTTEQLEDTGLYPSTKNKYKIQIYFDIWQNEYNYVKF